MAVAKAHEKYSYADYRSWPEEERWELIDGEAFAMSPAPSSTHQRIVGEIFVQIHAFLSNTECAVFVSPLDVKLSTVEEDDAPTVVQPDIIVCCDKEKITEQGINGAPDLVIEVVSPSSGVKDRKTKFDLYENRGVGEYWIVNTEEKVIEIYRRIVENPKKFTRTEACSRDDRPGIAAFPVLKWTLPRSFGNSKLRICIEEH